MITNMGGKRKKRSGDSGWSTDSSWSKDSAWSMDILALTHLSDEDESGFRESAGPWIGTEKLVRRIRRESGFCQKGAFGRTDCLLQFVKVLTLEPILVTFICICKYPEETPYPRQFNTSQPIL
jgi:hypothetical protein